MTHDHLPNPVHSHSTERLSNLHLNASARLPTMGTHGGDGISSHGLAASIAAAFVDCWRNDDSRFALANTLMLLKAISVQWHKLMTLQLIRFCTNSLMTMASNVKAMAMQPMLAHFRLRVQNAHFTHFT